MMNVKKCLLNNKIPQNTGPTTETMPVLPSLGLWKTPFGGTTYTEPDTKSPWTADLNAPAQGDTTAPAGNKFHTRIVRGKKLNNLYTSTLTCGELYCCS